MTRTPTTCRCGARFRANGTCPNGCVSDAIERGVAATIQAQGNCRRCGTPLQTILRDGRTSCPVVGPI